MRQRGPEAPRRCSPDSLRETDLTFVGKMLAKLESGAVTNENLLGANPRPFFQGRLLANSQIFC
jgi:hypothetical protein